MNRLSACLLLFAWAAVPALPAVRWKTRTLHRPSTANISRKSLDPQRRHYVLQLDGVPTPAMRREWHRRGIRVNSWVPDAAVVVSAPAGEQFQMPGVQWATEVERQDKFSPLAAEEAPHYFIVDFYPDVDMDKAGELVTASGLDILSHADLLPNQLLISGEMERVASLGDWDEVAYIFPASEDLVTGAHVTACAGAATVDGPVAQYVKVSNGWSASPDGVALSYVFTSLTSKLPASTVQSEIVRALNEWAKYVRLSFTQGTAAAATRTIAILFASGAHADAYPFDGPGRVLAHTFYPAPPNPEPLAGDMHLDADESWDNRQQVDLYTVALHEGGHALGLGHSDRPGAIMYPYYRAGAQISDDDISGIRALYGSPNSKPLPLALLISNPPVSNVTVSSSTIAISGTVIGGSYPVQVTWRTGRGQTGVAAGSGSWSIAAVPLSDGANSITITVTDATGAAVARTITVTKQKAVLPPATPATPPAPPTGGPGNPPSSGAPPALKITSPAFTIVSTSAAAITLRGTASADATVTWTSSAGDSGTATGSVNWSAEVALQLGTNNITVRATNASGSAWRSISVVRR